MMTDHQEPTGGKEHGNYWVLSDSEPAKGFIRPVRVSCFTATMVVTTKPPTPKGA